VRRELLSRWASKALGTLHVWDYSVRIHAIEFRSYNSRQFNERTRFAMITYTYNSNISHLASREHYSTCVATLSSLDGYVEYVGRVAVETVYTIASCQTTRAGIAKDRNCIQ
jgi:hypothetical protein